MFDKQIEYVRKKLPEIAAHVRAALVVGILGLIMTAKSMESRFLRSEEIIPERTVTEEMLYLQDQRESSREEPTLIDREIRENIVRFERGVKTDRGDESYNKSGTATVLETIMVNGRTIAFILGADHVSEKHSVTTYFDLDNKVIPTTEAALIASPQIGVIRADLLGCEQYVEEGSEVGSDLSICAVSYSEPTNFHDITDHIESAHEYIAGEEVATYGYPSLLNNDSNGDFGTVPFWSNSTIPLSDNGYTADYTTSSNSRYLPSWSSGESAGYDGLDFIATEGMSGGPVVAGIGDENQKIVSIFVSGNEHAEHAKVSKVNAGIQDIPSNFMSWYAHVKEKTLQALNRRAR